MDFNVVLQEAKNVSTTFNVFARFHIGAVLKFQPFFFTPSKNHILPNELLTSSVCTVRACFGTNEMENKLNLPSVRFANVNK